jgi:chromosome segregation protein
VPGATALAGLVAVKGPFGGLIRFMLASALLVDGLADAVLLARQHPELIFVTPDGDMAASGGIVTGGSADQVRKGIIHKKREIKELEEAVTTLERETASLADERDELRRRSQEVAEELRITGSKVHQAELRRTGLAKDSQQTADELARIEERLALQAMETATLDEEREGLEVELKQSLERLGDTGGVARGLEQEVGRLKEELEARRAEMAGARERVTAIRVQAATLKEQHEARVRDIVDLERQVGELTRYLAADRQELDAGNGERLRLLAAIAAETERLEVLVSRQADAESLLAGVRSACEEAGAALAEAESRTRKGREESDAVRQLQAELNLRFSTLTMQAEHLERSVLENSRISMAEALSRLEEAEFDEPARRARQAELQRLLHDMGEVNLLAIEECAGMEERFNFLTSQKNDLEVSLRSLQQAIQRINRTTRQRFLETYNQVNAKFQEVFPRLFCGGRAELRLTNEEDLLETGIDIIVQPPGKKLQNVTLLSGGEKALTAVALIFSIFLIKPTPFCLLDEVDAPLDDANIGRFNDIVREMCAVSQFIIITHNKATMQVADTLYGITMEEPGASRVVSVRLH